MYTIIICVIIFSVAFFISSINDGWSEVFDIILNTFLGAIVGIAVGFLIALILPMDTYVSEEQYKIEALQDNGSTSGQFFLGSGHIDGSMVYVMYIEETDGVYVMLQVEHTSAKIKYSESPIVHVYQKKAVKGSLINKWAIDTDLKYKNYIIEIPKGTIQNNYQLDAH